LKTDGTNDINQDVVSPAIPTHSNQNVSAVRIAGTGVNAPSLEAMQSPFFYYNTDPQGENSRQHGHFTPHPSGQSISQRTYQGSLTPRVIPATRSTRLPHMYPVKSGQITTVDDVDALMPWSNTAHLYILRT
jgi:hypothetical protein